MKSTNTLSQAQHTPGPWTVKPLPTPDEYETTLGDYTVEPAHSQLWKAFAKTEKMEPGSEAEEIAVDGIHATNQANARLIAAAPDLLAALEAIVELAEPGDALPDEMPILEKARAAIAAANGNHA